MPKIEMFKPTQPAFDFDIDKLLEPYLYLDKTLIKGNDDGLACFKKYSNKGNGANLKTISLFKRAAAAILENNLTPQKWLAFVDGFVLFSNMIDQHRFEDINAKLPEDEPKTTVVNYLEAAFKISPHYDYNNLAAYSPRELSSHAQLLHYLAKAQRYVDVDVNKRLEKLQNALTIANYLTDLGCEEHDDPHAHQGRIATYKLRVQYCLQDLGQFDDAAAFIKDDAVSDNPFHVIQANIELANIYIQKYTSLNQGTEQEKAGKEALQYAQTALDVSAKTGECNDLLKFNARVCKMNVLQAIGSTDEATELANKIKLDTDNPKSGAKPSHREAAEKVLEANQSVRPNYF